MGTEIEMEEIDVPIEGPENLVRPLEGDPWGHLFEDRSRVRVRVWVVNGGVRVVMWAQREEKGDEFSTELSDADTEVGFWNE
jgi:hypothetical protein